MGISAGFMVPHPPLIIPDVGRGEEKKIQKTIDAYQEGSGGGRSSAARDHRAPLPRTRPCMRTTFTFPWTTCWSAPTNPEMKSVNSVNRRGACRMPGRSSSAVCAGCAGEKYGRDMDEKTIVTADIYGKIRKRFFARAGILFL